MNKRETTKTLTAFRRGKSVNCTGDACVGDIIQFSEGVFGGSHRKPRFLGERMITARIIRDSYGQAKQQHTFSLDLIACEGIRADDVLRVQETRGYIMRKGRNLYRNGTKRLPRDDSERAEQLADKHARGDQARSQRQLRRHVESLGLHSFH